MKYCSEIIGFMQGRLCDQVDGKIQAFPWRDWHSEFAKAKSIRMSIMEWTLDHERLYENPLMTDVGQEKIRLLSLQHGIKIPSLTGDCFMQAPFWKARGKRVDKLKNDFLLVCEACSSIGIGMIIVPLVDGGRLENGKQEQNLLDFLLANENFFLDKKIKIIFESDYEPAKLKRFISQLPSYLFGVNYDIGNSAALGFNPIEEFAHYGERILNVHVKDRIYNGNTVPLGSGCVNFKLVFSELKKINYSGRYILQTARAMSGNHAELIAKYRDMVINWITELDQL